MYLQLIRSEHIFKDGDPVQTIGWLYVYNEENKVVDSFATLELAWKDNKTGISCIPPKPSGYSTYEIELLDSSPAFNYEHYLIKDVPNRKYIKIHRGNYYTQIEGCILIGLDHTDINQDGVVDVTSSTLALRRLIALVGQEGTLDIKSLLEPV